MQYTSMYVGMNVIEATENTCKNYCISSPRAKLIAVYSATNVLQFV